MSRGLQNVKISECKPKIFSPSRIKKPQTFESLLDDLETQTQNIII